MPKPDAEPIEQVECGDRSKSVETRVVGMCCDGIAEKPVEMEDGELPEDGEITDDVDDEREPCKISPPAVPGSLPRNRSAPYAKRPTNVNMINEHTNATNAEGTNVIACSEDNTRSRQILTSNLRAQNEGASQDHRFEETQRPRRRQPWTETVLCKFFRLGYCRDNDLCSYSHNAAHSNRKPQVCKFYHAGFCKKGLSCTLLHGEYPCKEFHEGTCDKNPCKYSHTPLNDYTRAIFEQVVHDEDLASKICIPRDAPRRRVLLPTPATAPIQPESVALRESPAHKHEPLGCEFVDDPCNATDDRVVKSVFVAQTASEDPDEAMVAKGDYMSPTDVGPSCNGHLGFQESSKSFSFAASALPPYTEDMSLSDMYDMLAKTPLTYATKQPVVLHDSSSHESRPASVSTFTTNAMSTTENDRGHILASHGDTARELDADSTKDVNLPQFRHDPHMHSMVGKQAPSDPRIRKGPNNADSELFHRKTPTVRDMDPAHLQSLAEQQMKMMNQQMSVQEIADSHVTSAVHYGPPFLDGPCFDHGFSDERYNDGGYFRDDHYDYGYGSFDDYDSLRRRSQRYSTGGLSPTTRGRDRGYYEEGHKFRGGRYEHVDVSDARRDYYHYEERGSRDYPSTRPVSTRYGRERSRSRSPQSFELSDDERLMSLLVKRENYEY